MVVEERDEKRETMMMRGEVLRVLVGRRSRMNQLNQSICCHAGFARVSVSTLLSTHRSSGIAERTSTSFVAY
jgi:hypothetical protein